LYSISIVNQYLLTLKTFFMKPQTLYLLTLIALVLGCSKEHLNSSSTESDIKLNTHVVNSNNNDSTGERSGLIEFSTINNLRSTVTCPNEPNCTAKLTIESVEPAGVTWSLDVVAVVCKDVFESGVVDCPIITTNSMAAGTLPATFDIDVYHDWKYFFLASINGPGFNGILNVTVDVPGGATHHLQVPAFIPAIGNPYVKLHCPDLEWAIACPDLGE
jgi:hypothetical protein